MDAGGVEVRVQWEPRSFANERGIYIQYEPEHYDALLDRKAEALQAQFRASGFLPSGVAVEVCRSASEHYRSRCKFGIAEVQGELCYVMWEFCMPEADRVYFKQFPLATDAVNSLMLRLLDELPGLPQLRENLVRAHFLCATTGDAIVTLLYSAPLREDWPGLAAQLGERLQCSVMARSREEGTSPNPRFWKPTATVGRSYVSEAYTLRDGRCLRYRQPEGSFSNPNASVCIGTLDWLCSVVAAIDGAKEASFLELYCGNGNHTVALAPYFKEVVGVELDPALVEAANENLASNGVANARVYCLPSGRYCSKMLHARKSRGKRLRQEQGRHKRDAQRAQRAAEGGTAGAVAEATAGAAPEACDRVDTESSGAAEERDEAQAADPQPDSQGGMEELMARRFSTVLVDPPRSGLDAVTLRFLKSHHNILYISCNPEALQRDLAGLCRTHQVDRFCVFDHFPYTKHAECGVYLRRRPRPQQQQGDPRPA